MRLSFSIFPAVRQALRRLAATPAFTATAVLTLGLGIGGATAAFSVVNAVLLRPLPYPEADRLVVLRHDLTARGLRGWGNSEGTYYEYRKATNVLASLGAYKAYAASLTGDFEPQRVTGASVTASFFPTLGIRPALGRLTAEEDDRPGAAPVVVLSHALWADRFGADPGVVGRTLRLDGVARQVVGVMPPQFRFPDGRVRFWVPIQVDWTRPPNPVSFRFDAVARLRPGVTPEVATAVLAPLLQRVPYDLPSTFTPQMWEDIQVRVWARPLRDDLVGDLRPVLGAVLGTVAAVLLIAVANIANLFLVRAEGRMREMAVRVAIGARRADLTRLSLAESLTVSAAGAALGMLLAWAALRLVVRFSPAALPRAEEIALDGAALGVALLALLGSALLFGLLPVVRADVAHLLPLLRDGRGGTAGRTRQRVRNAFVVVQVALALVLLVGSGLMARTFWRLRHVEPGVKPEAVLTFHLSLPNADYPDPARRARTIEQVVDRLRAVPGVREVAATSSLPLADPASTWGIYLEDRPGSGGSPQVAGLSAAVTPGYFRALGIPLVAGRTFSGGSVGDTLRARREVVVSRSFAERFLPGRNVVGRRLRVMVFNDTLWQTIVGVAGDVNHVSLAQPAEQMVYLPLLHPKPTSDGGPSEAPALVSVAVRAATDAAALALLPAVGREVSAIDRDLPIADARLMTAVAASAVARTSFTMAVLGVAAATALLLGAVGLYGVVAYAVSLRTRELGVRLALGALPGQVRAMVLRQGLLLAAAGVAVGLAGALGLSRFIGSLLYGVERTDLLTFAAVPVVLLAVSTIACWLPARRAARVDPIVALRSE